MNSITDLLPMLPWEGPPLPRCLGIFWPWSAGGGQTIRIPLQLPQFPIPFTSESATIYENEELIEWTDWKGRERKARITRKVTRR